MAINFKTVIHISETTKNRNPDEIAVGNHVVDIPRADILSPWDFPPKVPVISFRFLGEGEHRAETCSGDNVGV